MAAAFSATSFFLFFLLSLAATFADHEPTHLRFYLHESIVGTPNATAVITVSHHPNSTSGGFGDIAVFDDPLREGVELSSPLIGRAQGITVFTSLSGSGELLVLNIVFTAGKYNGSTLALLGLYSRAAVRSERSIIGGTGQFRMARGYALSELVRELTVLFDIYLTYN